MHKTIKEFLTNYNIQRSTPIVAAISGGIDSMVLLDLLKTESDALTVVHFNHLKRVESLEEKKLVEQFCLNNNINFKYHTVDVKKGNFQSEARDIRYDLLVDECEELSAKYILTAHHLDDLLETILMKITRGSNLYGYAGIHEVVKLEQGVSILRALLTTTKLDIIKYAKDNHIPFLEDKSNYSDEYTRNRYRHAVIPIMKQENEGLLNNAYNYHLQLVNAFNFIRKHSLDFLMTHDNVIDNEAFKGLDIAIKHDTIACYLEQHSIIVSSNLINDITLNILSETPNLKLDVSKEYVLVKSYGKSILKKRPQSNKTIEIVLNEGSNVIDKNTSFTFFTKTCNEIVDFQFICYNKLKFPLLIRNRKSGDVLEFTFGKKKLKDFLIDKKIPRDDRDKLLLLVDSDDRIILISGLFTNLVLGNENKLYYKFNYNRKKGKKNNE